MSDYNLYDFSIKESELIKAIQAARKAGYNPLIVINGMYYDIVPDKDENKK